NISKSQPSAAASVAQRLAPAPVQQPATTAFADMELLSAGRALRQLYGNRAVPNSVEQLETIVLAVRLQQDVLLVSPTGSGKSAVFLSIAILHPQLTVLLFAPYRILMSQYMELCTSRSISCAKWIPDGSLDEKVSVLIVSVEDMESEKLAGYIAQ